MNKVSKTMRKGFTLVELMVVMAIMGILLVAVMSMTTPVSRMFRRTSVSENVYSAGDNITNYLQRTLQYADNVWVFDGSEPEAGNLRNTASAFKKAYYNHVIVGTAPSGPTSCKFVDGKVHVLRLSNSDGKIYKSDYKFQSNIDSVIEEAKDQEVLNPAYFDNDYKDYNFRYALGSSSLEVAEDGGAKVMDGTEFVFNLKSEKDAAVVDGGYDRFSMTIVANRGKTPAKINGAYRFVGPCTSTVLTIPLTNITIREGKSCNRLFVPASTVSDDIHSQLEAATSGTYVDYRVQYLRPGDPDNHSQQSFINLAKGNAVSFDNDIYIVYSYADEIK